MSVTNREAEQWNRVAHAAAMRRLAEARQAEIARLLAAPPTPLPITGAERAMPLPVIQEQRRLF